MATTETRASTSGATHIELELPAALSAGARERITYRLSDAGSGQPLTDVTESHERPMHLIVVSNDLTEFQHVHPEETGRDGEYAVEISFPKDDRYMMFADFTRVNGDTIIERETVRVGQGEEAPHLRPDRGPVKRGGTVATLHAPEPIRAGQAATFTVRFAAAVTGEPLHDLQSYLGAAAHVIVLGEDGSGFAHAHGEAGGGDGTHGGHHRHGGETMQQGAAPAAFGPEIRFDHEFEAPGLYKIWVQTRTGSGDVVTQEFVVGVAA